MFSISTLALKSTGEGRNVVLLHGLFGQSGSLSGLSRALKDDYRVHSIDLPGHGKSPALASMTLPDIAKAVWAALDSAGIERPHLIGHSLGGKVAMQMAALNAERPKSITVLDIAPVAYPDDSHDSIFAAINSVDVTVLRSREQADEQMSVAIQERGVRQFLLTNLQRVRGSEGYAWRIDFDLLQRVYPELAAAPTLGHRCDAPCTVVKGALSDYIRDEHVSEFQQRFSNCVVHTIPDTGHWLHVEKPQQLVELIRASIQQIG